MHYRVEQLAARTGVSVDTVRFYQSRGLVPPPRRDGRVALYHEDHVDRIDRIKDLRAKGFTLGAIKRLLTGELDEADEALVEAMVGRASGSTPEELLTLDEVADRSGIPRALLDALVREGLLVPRVPDGERQWTSADVEAAASGLRLLEHGLPLPEILALARRHHEAMRAVAEEAVALFDAHVRAPLRGAGRAEGDAGRRLVEAFDALLPATSHLVTHHFTRLLLAVAQEHIDSVGDESERALVRAESARRLEVAWPA